MIDLKLLNLNHGDSQKDLSDKLNYNFSQILAAGDGAYGSIGDVGPIGANGDLGITGPQGDQGFRGSVWFVQDSEPSSGATGGDYWVDTLNGFVVYKYTYSSGSYSWVNQGFVLAQTGVFTLTTTQTGLTSGNPNSAYVQGLFAPEKRTLVLTDQVQSDVKNPQLSKVLIGNAGTGPSGAYPLLEFSKTDYQSDPNFNLRTPKFEWMFLDGSVQLPYTMILFSNNGLEINTEGIEFSNFSYFQAGQINPSGHFYDGWGGLTGEFSGEAKFVTNDEIYLQTGETGGNYPITWSVKSANVPQWDNDGLFANTSFIARGEGNSSNTQTFTVTNGFNYLRSKSYVTGENVLRMKYTGNSSFSSGGSSVSSLASDRDLYVVDSDGNNKYSKKISGFFPNPGISGATNTGTFSHTDTGVVGNYYTVLSTIDTTTTGAGATYRFSIGDTYFMDYNGSAAPSRALGIFLDGNFGTKYGFAALTGSDGSASFTFKIIAPNAANGFNAIFVDSITGNTNPSTGAKTFANSDTNFNFIDGDSNPSRYATTVEATIVLQSFSNNWWKIYWKAYGGNLDGIKCGCVSTT